MFKLNQRPFFRKLWLITAIASAGLLYWKGPQFAGSFSAGCIGMILNFYALFSLLEGIFHGDNAKQATYLFLLMGKFLALGLGIWFAVRYLHVELLPFGLGFFLVAISATYATSTAEKGSAK